LVAGVDGVGSLRDGRRVYFAFPDAPFGTMAQKAVVAPRLTVPVPDDLDDVAAAAIGNPGMSSWAAFTERAHLVPGETVMVNGATGAAGRLSLQIAKHLGAKKVIALGREPSVLKTLANFGADVTIDVTQPPDVFSAALDEQFGGGVDVVIDYIWGPTAQQILQSAAKMAKSAAPIRFVQVGSVSAPEISLNSAILRSAAIMLMGSGIGSVAMESLMAGIGEVLRLATREKFSVETKAIPLNAVAGVWNDGGSRARIVFKVT
jgi:NADPH:quinone reductase-like Zn-dependent oxidoreductase